MQRTDTKYVSNVFNFPHKLVPTFRKKKPKLLVFPDNHRDFDVSEVKDMYNQLNYMRSENAVHVL